MAPKPKGKGKKKKTLEIAEPPHDPSWERTVETGIWERQSTDLPDANTWPTWGALRERVLTACKEINIVHTASLRDAFAAEIVKLSPPELSAVNFSESLNLHNFILSPMGACPKVVDLDLSRCPTLQYVLIQSSTLRTLQLSGCNSLTKVLIHCPRLSKVSLTDCTKLDTLMLWSDEITELDLTGCNQISSLKLQCPTMIDSKIPPLKTAATHVKPSHPALANMLKDNYADAARLAGEERERDWKTLREESVIAHVHRPF